MKKPSFFFFPYTILSIHLAWYNEWQFFFAKDDFFSFFFPFFLLYLFSPERQGGKSCHYTSRFWGRVTIEGIVRMVVFFEWEKFALVQSRVRGIRLLGWLGLDCRGCRPPPSPRPPRQSAYMLKCKSREENVQKYFISTSYEVGNETCQKYKYLSSTFVNAKVRRSSKWG
jgi:hypothetical protein